MHTTELIKNSTPDECAEECDDNTDCVGFMFGKGKEGGVATSGGAASSGLSLVQKDVDDASEEVCDEGLNGEHETNYRGCQDKTVKGVTCKPWKEVGGKYVRADRDTDGDVGGGGRWGGVM